jgi:hypothetical protein
VVGLGQSFEACSSLPSMSSAVIALVGISPEVLPEFHWNFSVTDRDLIEIAGSQKILDCRTKLNSTGVANSAVLCKP